VRLVIRRLLAASAAAALLAASLTGCGGSDDSSGGSTTLTYWASNQGSSLEADKQVLQPELDKFEQQTGITVNLEVVPWSDLLNRLLAAARVRTWSTSATPGRRRCRRPARSSRSTTAR
jgi:multiple sugar transport system substrate-binding protein